MKKIITTALMALLSINSFSQLVPNEDTPIGFIYDFNASNYTYYTSIYPSSGTGTGTIGTAEGNIKYTGTTNATTFQLQIYKTIAGGTPVDGVDMSSNPIIYLKLKGQVNDILEVAVKNKGYYDANTDTDIPERYFGGYPIRKTITCSDYSWYKFDFTTIFGQQAPNYTDVAGTNVAATKNHIYEFEFSNKGDLTGRSTFDILVDSVIIGNTGISPKLPVAGLPTIFKGDFTNDYFRGSQPTGNTISIANNEMTCNIGATSAANTGVQYQLNNGAGNQFFNITSFPKTVASIKAAAGDTIQVNFLYGKNYKYVDGWEFKQKLTSSNYETLTFDFSASTEKLDSVYLVEFIHNPLSKGAATFYINNLTIGQTTESCSVVGIKDETIKEIKTDVYPNPAIAGEAITLSNKFNSIEFVNLNGVSLATVQANDQSVTVPTSLKAGMYIMVMKGENVKSFTKFQVK